jgi:hypothetical protein
MRSIKAGLGATIVLTIVAVLAAAAADYATGAVAKGEELSLRWRIALSLANWYVRLEPILAVGGIAGAAIVGALQSRGATLHQERRLLLGWLVVGTATVVVELATPMPTSLAALLWWSHLSILSLAVGTTACVASVIVATHLQSRLRALGSPVRAWQVGAISVACALLGPMMLVPAIAVWAHAGRVLRHAVRESA